MSLKNHNHLFNSFYLIEQFKISLTLKIIFFLFEIIFAPVLPPLGLSGCNTPICHSYTPGHTYNFLFTCLKCALIFVLSGLFVGPLIRKYSYRKVALVGSALSAIGLIATFPAGNMAHIISTYSIVGGKCLDTSCVYLNLHYVCCTV